MPILGKCEVVRRSGRRDKNSEALPRKGLNKDRIGIRGMRRKKAPVVSGRRGIFLTSVIRLCRDRLWVHSKPKKM